MPCQALQHAASHVAPKVPVGACAANYCAFYTAFRVVCAACGAQCSLATGIHVCSSSHGPCQVQRDALSHAPPVRNEAHRSNSCIHRVSEAVAGVFALVVNCNRHDPIHKRTCSESPCTEPKRAPSCDIVALVCTCCFGGRNLPRWCWGHRMTVPDCSEDLLFSSACELSSHHSGVSKEKQYPGHSTNVSRYVRASC